MSAPEGWLDVALIRGEGRGRAEHLIEIGTSSRRVDAYLTVSCACGAMPAARITDARAAHQAHREHLLATAQLEIGAS